jgi:hypothetical protein
MDFRHGDIWHQLIRPHLALPSYAKLPLNATETILYWGGACDKETSGSTWWKIKFFSIRIHTFSKIVASENPKIPINLLRYRNHQTWTNGHICFCNLTETLSRSSRLCTVRALVLWLPNPEDTLYYSDITVILAFDSVPSNFIHDTSNKASVSTIKVY